MITFEATMRGWMPLVEDAAREALGSNEPIVCEDEMALRARIYAELHRDLEEKHPKTGDDLYREYHGHDGHYWYGRHDYKSIKGWLERGGPPEYLPHMEAPTDEQIAIVARVDDELARPRGFDYKALIDHTIIGPEPTTMRAIAQREGKHYASEYIAGIVYEEAQRIADAFIAARPQSTDTPRTHSQVAASSLLKGAERTIDEAWRASAEATQLRNHAREAQTVYMRLTDACALTQHDQLLPHTLTYPVVQAARERVHEWYALANIALREQLATMGTSGKTAIKQLDTPRRYGPISPLDKPAPYLKGLDDSAKTYIMKQIQAEAVNPHLHVMACMVLRAAANLPRRDGIGGGIPGTATPAEVEALRAYHKRMVDEALKGNVLPLPDSRTLSKKSTVRKPRKVAA